MNRIRPLLLTISAILLAVSSFVSVPTAYADATDEASMSRVNQQLDTLWEFVDSSAEVPDTEFYPEFITKTQYAHDEIAKTYQELGHTKETHDTKKAIQTLREDIQMIQSDLLAWRDAASASDTLAFEDASYMLSDSVDTYNMDIDTYNTAAYGTKALVSIAFHAAQFLLAFSLSALLFAWAVYRNHKTGDVVQEILRRLRWHIALSSLGLVVSTAIPAYLYFLTDIVQPLWTWALVALPLLAVVYALVRYIKMARFAK